MSDTFTERTDILVPIDPDKEPIEWDGNGKLVKEQRDLGT